MNSSTRILSGLAISVFLCGASIAATVTEPAHGQASSDCRKLGSEVSALIDSRTDSPNIAAARSVFQVGIMECMEGSDESASRHYQEVKTLLGGEQQKPTASIRLPTAGQ